MAKKTISIFGSTGSIGTTTLEIIRENKEKFDVKDFIKEHFRFLNKNVFLFFNSYQKEIVGRIVSFKEQFKSLIIKDKPNILLLGIGTRDVFDTICCYVANHHNIPIIFFHYICKHNLIIIFLVVYFFLSYLSD